MAQWVKLGFILLLVPFLSSCDDFWNKKLELKSVTLEQMDHLMQNNNWVLVDARDSDGFNGWPSGGDLQGGHIPKALNFDLEWMDAAPELVGRLLTTKAIVPEKGVIVYGRDKQDAQVLAQWLVTERGFSDHKVRVFESGFSGWLAAGGEPEKLPAYQKLVTPKWLEAHRTAIPELKILDVSHGKGLRYLTGHIPGALHLDIGLLESEPLWNINQAKQLEAALLDIGITYKTPVVVYGDDMMAAARVIFVLRYAGVKDVRLLNGGWQAWQKSGLSVERGFNRPTQSHDFGVFIPENRHIVSSTDDVAEIVAGNSGYLVSIRSRGEYTGEVSGYSYIESAGRIPGALWGRSGSDAYSMEDYLNPDNTLREYHDIESYWQVHGLTQNDAIAFYCGTGWRASLAWFAAKLMNYPNVTVYDGGWMEWSSDPSRPIDKG